MATTRPSATELLAAARHIYEHTGRLTMTLQYSPLNGGCHSATVKAAADSVMLHRLESALRVMRRDLGSADWIALISDGFVTDGSDPEVQQQPGRARGVSHVTEQLAAVMVDRDGGTTAMTQSHRWSPVSGLEWDDPEPLLLVRGHIIDVMRRYLSLAEEVIP